LPVPFFFVTDENQFLRFDRKGKFLNNRFKKARDLEYKPFICYQDFLFTVEEDEKGNKLIIKYKI